MARTTRTSSHSLLRAAFGALALLALAATAGPASANECNPIAFLFGGCHQEAIRPASAPLSIQPVAARPRPHAAATQRRHAPAATRAVARTGPTHTNAPVRVTIRRAVLTEMKQAPTGSLAQFAADPTLRSGDIVVTSEGFRVYRGGHFSPITGGGALAALENASMRAPTMDYASPMAARGGDGRGFLALRKATRLALRQ